MTSAASKIILTVNIRLTEQEVGDLGYMPTDALSEFAETRANPAEYVRKRCPDDKRAFSTYDGKLAQVERLVAGTQALHDAAPFDCEDVK